MSNQVIFRDRCKMSLYSISGMTEDEFKKAQQSINKTLSIQVAIMGCKKSTGKKPVKK